MRKAIGLDVGGTRIKGIVMREDGEVLQRHQLPTDDATPGTWLQRVAEMLGHLRSMEGADAVVAGVSAPGLVGEGNRAIRYMPGRLEGLNGLEWSTQLGMPAWVLNDAHAATFAEHRYGALSGCRHGLLVTLGTGVGGGIIADGMLHQGMHQMAGHFGHTVLHAHDDERSLLGMPGSLEYALGNYSVQRRSHGRYADTLGVVEAMHGGDPFAQWLWLDMVRNLAVALASMANAWSPERIVLAGGITQAAEDLMQPLRRFLEVYEFRPDGIAREVALARFSELSGAVGAAAYALDQAS